MNTEPPEVGAILARIDALERQNGRLKRITKGIGAALLLIGACTLLVGQTNPNIQKQNANERIFHAGTIRAGKVELVSPGGDVRAELSASPKGAAFTMFDGDGKASLLISTYMMARPELGEIHSSGLIMLGSNGHELFSVGPAFSGGSMLMLGTADGKSDIAISVHPGDPTEARINLVADAPLVHLGKLDGFQTDIGSTDLVTPTTGATHRTSAASVVLIDKNGHVIWSAP